MGFEKYALSFETGKLLLTSTKFFFFFLSKAGVFIEIEKQQRAELPEVGGVPREGALDKVF
jgi:hypothetical protein